MKEHVMEKLHEILNKLGRTYDDIWMLDLVDEGAMIQYPSEADVHEILTREGNMSVELHFHDDNYLTVWYDDDGEVQFNYRVLDWKEYQYKDKEIA